MCERYIEMRIACLVCSQPGKGPRFKNRTELREHQNEMHGGRDRPPPYEKDWCGRAMHQLRKTEDYETKKRLLRVELRARSTARESGKRNGILEQQLLEASMREWFDDKAILDQNTTKNERNVITKGDKLRADFQETQAHPTHTGMGGARRGVTFSAEIGEPDEDAEFEKLSKRNTKLNMEESGKEGRKMKGKLGFCADKKRRISPPPDSPPPDSD